MWTLAYSKSQVKYIFPLWKSNDGRFEWRKIPRKGIYGVYSLHLTSGTTALPAEAADTQSTKHPYPTICCKLHPREHQRCSHPNTHQVPTFQGALTFRNSPHVKTLHGVSPHMPGHVPNATASSKCIAHDDTQGTQQHLLSDCSTLPTAIQTDSSPTTAEFWGTGLQNGDTSHSPFVHDWTHC